MREEFYGPDHTAFRDLTRAFVDRTVVPSLARWDEQRRIDRSAWREAGEHGILGTLVGPDHGGPDVLDFRYRCVVIEELARVGAASLSSGFSLNDDIVTPYLTRLGTSAQQAQWLPAMARGEAIAAIAMTEPGAGSDLRGIRTTAVRSGSDWVINGTKTFITNGIASDFVIVVARTGQGRSATAFSLLIVPAGTPGFSRGRQLDKVGLHAQDTAELIFEDTRVPADALLGAEGGGFKHLMDNLPMERLSIAYMGLAAAEAALRWTLDHVRQREAFGQRLIDFQNTKFRLAEMVTEVDVTRSFLREQVLMQNEGELDAVAAAKAKWWATEVQKRVVDGCVQLFGGYGYMLEYPIARAFVDGRVQTIYGGTTEVMKEIIGRSLITP